jgi:hypothetical protein
MQEWTLIIYQLSELERTNHGNSSPHYFDHVKDAVTTITGTRSTALLPRKKILKCCRFEDRIDEMQIFNKHESLLKTQNLIVLCMTCMLLCYRISEHIR